MNQATLWDLIEEAMDLDGIRTLHLSIGKPPIVRLAGEDLQPLHPSHPVMTWKGMIHLLTPVVEPERWEQLEQVGEGEFRLSHASGRTLRLVVFRSSEAWSAVVHL